MNQITKNMILNIIDKAAEDNINSITRAEFICELLKDGSVTEELIAELNNDLYQEVLAVKAETVIPENRCMELLNQIINHVSIANNTSDTIHQLVNMGFTVRELTQYFSFPKEDIPDDLLNDNENDSNDVIHNANIDTSSDLTGKALEFAESASSTDMDMIYRKVRYQYVINDIKDCIKDTGTELTDDQIAYAARKYAYDGKYDCNLSYWDNIENLIHLVRENETKNTQQNH